MLDFWLFYPRVVLKETAEKCDVGDMLLLTTRKGSGGTGLAEWFHGSKHLPLQHDNLSSVARTLVKGKNQHPHNCVLL